MIIDELRGLLKESEMLSLKSYSNRRKLNKIKQDLLSE